MKYIIINLLLIYGCTCLAQVPESDAVYQKITKEYILEEDGSITYHEYKKLKLLTHFSFNRLYGETFIVYNPKHQKLEINFSRTTHDDGKVTEAPVNAFNEVLPGFAAYAPYYNHLREMVVTHPGTEVGAVLELDYSLHSDAGYYPGLMADEVLTETSPVTEKEIIIRVPDKARLNYKVLNIRTAPEITSEAGQQVYTFRFKAIKEASHEPHQPADDRHLPRLIFSTLTWDEAVKALFEQPLYQYKTNEGMRIKVKEIRQRNRYDLPFILALNEGIANHVNHYPIPWMYIGYSARIPVETWQSNGGTALEKSLLFIALLRESGIPANPVLVIPSPVYDESIGCLPLIQDFLVRLNPRELEQMYLKATETSEQNRIYRLNGNTLIVLDPDKLKTIEVNESFENKVITNGNLILDDSLKVSGKVEIMMTEAANPFYAIEKDSSKVKSYLSRVPSKSIDSFGVINAAQYRSLANLYIDQKKAPENFAQYVFFELPENKLGSAKWHINFLHHKRSDPLAIPFQVNEQYSFTITLPEGVELLNPVELTEVKSTFGELVLSTVQKDNKVTVKRMLVINTDIIDLSDYIEFKRMADLWNEENFRKLVLKKD